MSDHRTGGLDPRSAEQLLAGGPAPDAPPGLAALLAAASGPARPEETAGEDAAVAAFIAARPAHRRALSRRIVIKVVTITAILAGSGGVAIAAGTGHLPGQDPGPAPTTVVPEPEVERDGVVKPPAVPRRTRTPSPSPSAKTTGRQPPGRLKPKRTPTPQPKRTTKKPNPGQGNGQENGGPPSGIPSTKAPVVVPRNSHAVKRD